MTGSKSSEVDIIKMYWKLAWYFRGSNKKGTHSYHGTLKQKDKKPLLSGVSMSMTMPISVEHREVVANTIYREMCLYVPREHQSDVPEPYDEQVYIKHKQDSQYYVK